MIPEQEKNKYSLLFLVAAIWNIVVATFCTVASPVAWSLLFDFEFPDGLVMMLFRIMVLAIALFGLGYYIVSRDPGKNRGIVWMATIGKITLFLLFTNGFFSGYVTTIGITLLTGDFLWGIAFIYFLYATRLEVQGTQLVG